ncbi:hypothetical protein DK926_19410 [Rhodococcus sp. Eu-32]|uniref:hypothetical protein n=1 Tax=Rhodococcus sp. Eu-32 TaxID=1017319 RepID=UPI000DF2723D|nr:hypothetical protein [Rhodococcus sp. Eu-32]RRQ26168.1 hypothetical protein DK926_19410 [Rhodococcus sp. Eu-32]
MEDDPEYRQALLESGHDPDDPRVRTAIADVVGLLKQIAEEERSGADPVIPRAEQELMHDTIARALDQIRLESTAQIADTPRSDSGVGVDNGDNHRPPRSSWHRGAS